MQCGLENVKVVTNELGQMLAEIGAKFAYILQVSQLEGRTWDNDGRVEDIATGSAAGPVGAYLIRHGIKQPNILERLKKLKVVNWTEKPLKNGYPTSFLIALCKTPNW